MIKEKLSPLAPLGQEGSYLAERRGGVHSFETMCVGFNDRDGRTPGGFFILIFFVFWGISIKKEKSMTEKIAIQDTYGDRFQYCWGCGAQNESGLNLKSYPSKDGKEVITKVKPGSVYTGGVPNNLFGGMIAMIFDCHGTASAAFLKHQARGLELTKETVIERFITAT